MKTYDRLLTNDFESEVIVYKDDNGQKVIYDTGAQISLDSPEALQAFLPVKGIDRLQKYSKDEVVMITKTQIAFGSEVPDTTGRKVYELPCQSMPPMLSQFKDQLPMLKSMIAMVGRDNLAGMLQGMAQQFGVNLPGISSEQIDLLLNQLDNPSMGDIHFPIVQFEVNGVMQNLLFDTGAPCHFTTNSSICGKQIGTRHEWLAMERQYGDLSVYAGHFKHASGFAFTTNQLASLVGHTFMTQQLELLNCQGVLGIEQLDQYDICLNKDKSVMFIK